MDGALGVACHWWDDAPRTWSGTPWHLSQALAARMDVVDLGFTLAGWQELVLKAAGTRRRHGRWVSQWRHSRAVDILGARTLQRAVRQSKVTVVLEFQDLAALDVPFMILQDMSYELLLDRWDDAGVPHFPGLSKDTIRRRRDRQVALYERAAMLLPMSYWLAASMSRDGIPASKIAVINPGATALDACTTPLPNRLEVESRNRLLFVGRDFHTKAGDQVVKSLAILRRDYDPRMTLTVAGPSRWPMAGQVPDGVDFLGAVPTRRVAQLYDEHDLLVLPSRFEGFGIVFAEALARGLPCVGRDVCAMPEIIDDGVTGALIRDEEPGRWPRSSRASYDQIQCTRSAEGGRRSRVSITHGAARPMM